MHLGAVERLLLDYHVVYGIYMTTKLFTDKEFDIADDRDELAFKCEHCGRTFYRTKGYVIRNERYRPGGHVASYCSIECHTSHRTDTLVETACSQCGRSITRKPSDIRRSKSGRQFCDHSCSATYNNLHKTTGTRRSKLEAHIEEELSRLYHNLEIIYNDKLAIGSELDVYIPSLRLAFELNGIYHYEPIHGQEKLDSIVVNDSRKFRDCIANRISLCIIDTSKQKYVTSKTSAVYMKVICDIIDTALRAASSPTESRTRNSRF